MKNRRWLFVAFALMTALALGFVAVLATADSHHTNARYILWKRHLWPYNADLALRYFNVDVDFRLSLIGKTRAELKTWYPVLTPLDLNDPRLPYYSDAMKTPGFAWIDGGPWGVQFEGDRVKDFLLFKG